ncbi:ferredoxin [methanogenic archaeon mixed culture ISO4-G1]|nr:ferredoxin [methanogenic archaeon mixed culture ISO4-G1]
MEKKFKILFEEGNVQKSVAYTLVSEFDLKPNVLKAVIDGDGSGVMILSLEGDEQKLDRAAERLREEGFDVTEMDKRISRDEELCFSCGACVSICPVMCFSYDPETWEVNIDNSKCIACGACVNSCARHALSLHL